MQKLLTTAANQLQSIGTVTPALVARIKKYDASHGMWPCLATDEMRDTWQAMKGLGLI